MQTKTTTVAVAMALCACAGACSSAPPYEGSSLDGANNALDEDPTGGATDDGPTGGNGAGSGSTSQPTTVSKNACSKEKTQKACFECCTAKAPGAVETYTNALTSCLCESPGTCKAACGATLCAGFKADAQCAECLRTNGTTCEDAAFSACEADSQCKAMLACSEEAGCSAK